MELIDELLSFQALTEQLSLSSSSTDFSTSRKEAYKAYIITASKQQEQTLFCPEFTLGLEWVNVQQPLSLSSDLNGKIVILDFFTYCCINCLHVLPDLHALEDRYSAEDGVVVIGVHSAKFPNEKDSNNIRQAVKRYNIKHAVVNDSDATMWNELQIQCWPTLVIVGPSGQIIAQFVGEGHREELLDFVSAAVDVYQDTLDFSPVPIDLGGQVTSSLLLYPGKLLSTSDDLIISDTGHHRLLICNKMNGSIKLCIGEGSAKNLDGNFNECCFHSPQGLCKINDCLYVADCEAHTIRQVDLISRQVTTIAGTGAQSKDMIGGACGTEQPLSSPWDVKPYCSIGSDEMNMLLIAAAGTHQIWAFFLTDGIWWKNTAHSAGTCLAIAGNGAEENRNNSYPLKAAFAQPSGLSVDYDRDILYIADSESSTVRQMSLKDGSVKSLVGGARDPTNLFAFGDADGKGVNVKLQHPLDVTVKPSSNYIVICDSYNHKMKLCDVKKKTVVTLEIDQLNEPGGVCYDSATKSLYIADTNNHAVIIADMEHVNPDSPQKTHTSQVKIHEEKDWTDSAYKPLFNHQGKAVKHISTLPYYITEQNAIVTFKYDLETGHHLTAESPSLWRATILGSDSGNVLLAESCGSVLTLDSTANSVKVEIPLNVSGTSLCDTSVVIEIILYYCNDEDGACKRNCLLITIPLTNKFFTKPTLDLKWYNMLPKVELHAHINGSISEKTLQELIEMKNEDEQKRLKTFITSIDYGHSKTLAECFEMFKLVHQIVNDKPSIYKAVCDVIKEFAADGVVYLELRSTPRDIPQAGITKRSYIETVLSAIKHTSSAVNDLSVYDPNKKPIIVRFLPSIDRRNSVQTAEEILVLAIEFREKTGLVVGIDLSGDGSVNDARDFYPVLMEAKQKGLKLAIHLAEVDGKVDETLAMLNIPPDRIGHGAFIHPHFGGTDQLFTTTMQKQIPLELCLTSNVKGNVTPAYSAHHFLHWYQRKHPLCICTDDKGIFATELSEEYKWVAEVFNLSKEEIATVARETSNFIFDTVNVRNAIMDYFSQWQHSYNNGQ